MDKTSKNSLDPVCLPISIYVQRALVAKKWAVYPTHESNDDTVIWAHKSFWFRKVKIRIRVQHIEGKFYITNFEVSGTANLLNPAIALEQHKKKLLKSNSDLNHTWDLWMVENGLGVTKFFRKYDEVAKDQGRMTLFS